MNSLIVERVKKLLALSKSSNINEAAAAAAIAHKYIVQYRINESDVIEQHSTSLTKTREYIPEPMFDDPEPIYVSARVTVWKLQLVCLLARHYGCAVWNDKHYGASKGGRGISRFRLIGRHNDIKLVKYMFSWLANEIQRISDIECRGQGHTYGASFCVGAVKGIQGLLYQGREQAVEAAEKTGHSKAIQRMDRRESEAQEHMRRTHNLIDPEQKPKFNANAFQHGVNTGNHIGKNINTPDE